MKPKECYLNLRRQYEPRPVKVVIIAESPPVSGKYFYDPEGSLSEPLFAAMMKQLNHRPHTKDEGLTRFKQRGWVLVDATYEPVNKHADSGRNMAISKRNSLIERDYPQLREDLDRLMPDRSTPIILIKANVCRTLEPILAGDGFNVLNRGRLVYFPNYGRQPDFRSQFSDIIVSARINGA